MRLAGHNQQIDEALADHRISADDRILIDYWRKQLISTMLSGDEDGSVQATLMLHKLLTKYKKRDDQR
jgi:hypothetical protein